MVDLKTSMIFSGNANKTLAKSVAKNLGMTVGKASVKTFSDGEISVEIEENVRGQDVYIIQPLCDPVNNNLMELLIMADALKDHLWRGYRLFCHILDTHVKTDELDLQEYQLLQKLLRICSQAWE